jgi:hypothetical protein
MPEIPKTLKIHTKPRQHLKVFHISDNAMFKTDFQTSGGTVWEIPEIL